MVFKYTSRQCQIANFVTQYQFIRAHDSQVLIQVFPDKLLRALWIIYTIGNRLLTLIVFVVHKLSLCHLVMAKVTLQYYFLAITHYVICGTVFVDVFKTVLTHFEREQTKVVPMPFNISFYHPLRTALVQTMHQFKLACLFMSFKITI